MLSALIPHIDSHTTGFVVKNGLAERITQTTDDSSTTFPAMYKGGQEYEPINFELQPSYHRMSGARVVAETENNIAGCSKALTITYPMLMIGCLKIDCESQYRFEQLSNEVANELIKVEFRKIRKELNVLSIELRVVSINSDRNAIWSQENENIPINIPFNYALFSIGYELVILTDSSCINTCCP